MNWEELSIRDRLKNLHEKLTDSSEHSVMDIAKEARRVFHNFTTNASAEKDNGEVDDESEWQTNMAKSLKKQIEKEIGTGVIPNQIQMQNSNLNSQQKAPNHASVITYPGQAGSHQAFVAPSNAGINLHSSSSGGP